MTALATLWADAPTNTLMTRIRGLERMAEGAKRRSSEARVRSLLRRRIPASCDGRTVKAREARRAREVAAELRAVLVERALAFADASRKGH